jgi:hypothetical protein
MLDPGRSAREFGVEMFWGFLGVLCALIVAALLVAGVIGFGAWACRDLMPLGCGR